MHKIHLLITVAELNVCRCVLLDVRGIVRVFEVFVQLLGLKLSLKPNYIILHVNQTILAAGSWEKPKELNKNRSPQGHFEGQNSSPLNRPWIAHVSSTASHSCVLSLSTLAALVAARSR